MIAKTPVAFFVFNRPDTTRRVLERIREARPEKLLVVCDGPRPHVPTDACRVAETREIIERGVDWPCRVQKNYAEINMGCQKRVASGLDWVFTQVEEAIILEDDCLPDPSFFSFCQEMLQRYRNDERVMHINGANFLARQLPAASCFFSKYVWVWGWATWRRAWQKYDPTMATWDERLPLLEKSFDSGKERAFWMSTFEHARADWSKTNTWDYQWIYTCWTLGGLSIFPPVNLVENIGFHAEATHTAGDFSHLHAEVGSVECFALPPRPRRNRWRDQLMFNAYMGETLNSRNRIRSALRVAAHSLSKLKKT